MAEKRRVAVAGVSGIGKHHAKWHEAAGCEVVGFLGRSERSCARAAAELRKIFAFGGRPYWDLERLLERERPEVVDVCLPNELHFECVLKALEAGAQVLCEKPLVWARDEAPQLLLEKARRLVDCARERRLQLGVCTQYAAALPHYMRLYESARGPLERIECFYAEMQTLARERRRDAAAIWVDMGSHPLSLLLGWLPEGYIDPDSLRVRFEGRQARALFDFVADQGVCRSEIVVRDIETGPPLRRFGINGFVAECQGRNNSEGIYRMVLRAGEWEEEGDDFMYLLIAQFVEALEDPAPSPLVPGALGLRNLELQLQIAQGARART